MNETPIPAPEKLVKDEADALTYCPMCNLQTPNLVKVEAGLRLGMVEQGESELPEQICGKCLKTWRSKISKGLQLKAENEVKANFKMDLWQNRIKYIRQARHLFSNKVYAEAAVSYEKYLKICEVCFDVSRENLKPKVFQDRPKELTIISSVLWDLMLIYDANIKYKARQEQAAQMLAEFLRFTPIYGTLVRKAELEYRRAKNPQVFRNFLKACDANVSRCFIASCAFNSHYHPTVRSLCRFRDGVLRPSPLGRRLLLTYYQYSPRLAAQLDRTPTGKLVVRILLRGVAKLVDATLRP